MQPIKLQLQRLRNRVVYPIVCLIINLIHRYIRGRATSINGVHILVYHRISPTQSADKTELWNITPETFAEHLKILREGNYTVLTITEMLECLTAGHIPSKGICLTFDDGFQNNYTYAFPLLLQYGMKASFYLATDYMDTDMFPWINKGRILTQEESALLKPLSWSEIWEMFNHKMEFGSHSCTHADFLALNDDMMKRELTESYSEISKRLGPASNGFVTPFGVWGDTRKKLIALLEASDYSYAFLGKWGAMKPGTYRFDLPRIPIYGTDSLEIFKQKIGGAFDWLSSIHFFWQSVRTIFTKIIFQKKFSRTLTPFSYLSVNF